MCRLFTLASRTKELGWGWWYDGCGDLLTVSERVVVFTDWSATWLTQVCLGQGHQSILKCKICRPPVSHLLENLVFSLCLERNLLGFSWSVRIGWSSVSLSHQIKNCWSSVYNQIEVCWSSVSHQLGFCWFSDIFSVIVREWGWGRGRGVDGPCQSKRKRVKVQLCGTGPSVEHKVARSEGNTKLSL